MLLVGQTACSEVPKAGSTRLPSLFTRSAPVLHGGLMEEGSEDGLRKPHMDHCISWDQHSKGLQRQVRF